MIIDEVPLSYTNSRGEAISFGAKSLYRYGGGNLFDLHGTPKVVGGRISAWVMEPIEIDLRVFMRGGSLAARDRFADILEYDRKLLRPGTLRAGESALSCYFERWEMLEHLSYGSQAVWDCTVKSDYPAWVRTVTQTLQPTLREDAGGLAYPHAYPHNYGFDAQNSAIVTNPFALPARADIAIPGPCLNPYVIIGANRYQVNVRVEAGQLLIVRGASNPPAIVLRSQDGTERSVWAHAVRDWAAGAHIFAEVPPGKLSASWRGDGAVEVKLSEERGTPSWVGLFTQTPTSAR